MPRLQLATHSMALEHAGRLAAGTYFLTLARGGRVVSKKVSVLQ